MKNLSVERSKNFFLASFLLRNYRVKPVYSCKLSLNRMVGKNTPYRTVQASAILSQLWFESSSSIKQLSNLGQVTSLAYVSILSSVNDRVTQHLSLRQCFTASALLMFGGRLIFFLWGSCLIHCGTFSSICVLTPLDVSSTHPQGWQIFRHCHVSIVCVLGGESPQIAPSWEPLVWAIDVNVLCGVSA